MHQREIDRTAGSAIGGIIAGLLLVFLAIFRWPGRTIIALGAGAIIVGITAVVTYGVDRYQAHAAEVKKQEEAEQEKQLRKRLDLLYRGDEIAFKVNFPVWRTMSGLTDLERLEYLGNGRAKEFRAKYKLKPENDPQIDWHSLRDYVEADIAAGDEKFGKTRAQVAHVLELNKPAERYLTVVKANTDYFAGNTTKLVLSEAFEQEFDRHPEMALTHPPVPAKARYPR